jgi:Tetratricopeptide repeat
MVAAHLLRRVFLLSALLLFAASIPAQQGGQQGGGGGGGKGGTGGGTSGGAQGSGQTTGSTTTPTTRTPQTTNQTQPGVNPNAGRQQQQMPFISGMVAMEDGSPLPIGVVIERICNGNKIKESHVSSGGQFSFQVGANTSMLMDASDSGWGSFGVPGASSQQGANMASLLGTGSTTALLGCELRADLPGYRSSTVILTGSQLMGRVIDVGTIVLHPIAKVQGTTVSLTSLRAPKDAKKALERGDKALKKAKLGEAETSFRDAVSIYPSYAAAWFSLGRIYQEQNRTQDARLAFSRARESDPNFVLPYVELARLAAVERNWKETAELTDHAVTLNPLDIPDGFFLNSLANYNLKNFDAAERSALKAQRLDSTHRLPLGHLILASILRQKQDLTGEAEQLRSYLKYAPQSSSAGQVQARLQELEKVIGPAATKEKSHQ